MKSFTIQITENGFVEQLFYEGRTYVKRYKKTDSGYEGLDLSWDLEDGLPDDLVEALLNRDPLEIMEQL